ncbi:hypothetical protein KoxyNG13_005400 [Klebsiella pasteurii]
MPGVVIFCLEVGYRLKSRYRAEWAAEAVTGCAKGGDDELIFSLRYKQ